MAAAHRALVAVAPTRLDFGGGWTDVPPYPEERGGFVCNLAITRFATVRVSDASHDRISGSADLAPALVRAALRRHDAHDVSVSLVNDFPVGAGLGGSSAALVALAAALRWRSGSSTTTDADRAAVAEISRSIEVDELEIAGGRQDHYAAAFGGALALHFGHETRVERIAASPTALRELEERCVVAFTGQSRMSGDTITAVLDAYLAREPRVVGALDQMKSLALSMSASLDNGDIDTLAELIDEHWVHQKSLHAAITTERIDAIERAVRSVGARGFKALGASGGGCVMAIAPRGGADAVRARMAPLATIVRWGVAHEGVTVREETGVMKRV